MSIENIINEDGCSVLSEIEIAFNEATAEYNQLKDVSNIVAAHSHLPAVETGLAIIKYLRG